MKSHEPRPLPDPNEMPYGMVSITIWEPTPGIPDQYQGRDFIPSHEVWRNSRNMHETFQAGDVVDWSFNGYRFDYFNRGYLLQPEQDPGPLVRLAMWALDRWAVDKGLKERTDKARMGVYANKIGPGESVEAEVL